MRRDQEAYVLDMLIEPASVSDPSRPVLRRGSETGVDLGSRRKRSDDFLYEPHGTVCRPVSKSPASDSQEPIFCSAQEEVGSPQVGLGEGYAPL